MSNNIIHMKKSGSATKLGIPPLLLSAKTQSSIQTQIASATPRTFENAAEYSNFLEDILSPITDVMEAEPLSFDMRNQAEIPAPEDSNLGPPVIPPKPPKLRMVNSSPLLNDALHSKSSENVLSNVSIPASDAHNATETDTTTKPTIAMQKAVSEDLLTPVNTDMAAGTRSFDNLKRLSAKADNLAPLSPLNPDRVSSQKSALNRPVINIPNAHPAPSPKSPVPKSPKSPISNSSNQSSHTPSPPTPQRYIVTNPYKFSGSDVNSSSNTPTPGSPQQAGPSTQLPLSKRAQTSTAVVVDKDKGAALGDIVPWEYQDRLSSKKEVTPVSSKKSRPGPLTNEESAHISIIKIQGVGGKMTGASADDLSIPQQPLNLKTQEGLGSGEVQDSMGSLGAVSGVQETSSPQGPRRKRDASISATTGGSIMSLSPFRGFFTLSKISSGVAASEKKPLHVNVSGKSLQVDEEVLSSPTSEHPRRTSLFGSGKDEVKRRDSIITEIKRRTSNVLNSADLPLQSPPPPVATRKNSTALGKSVTVNQKVSFDAIHSEILTLMHIFFSIT